MTVQTQINEAQKVADVQHRLRELGYVNAGPIDGDAPSGGKTEAAILDARNNLGLPLKPTIDAELIKALATASSKPVQIEQSTATAADIAPKIEAVNQTRWGKFWAKVTAIPSIILAFMLAVVEHFEDAVNYITPLKNFASDVPGWMWIGGAGAVATLIAFNLGKAEKASVDAYQKGTMRADNKVQPTSDITKVE